MTENSLINNNNVNDNNKVNSDNNNNNRGQPQFQSQQHRHGSILKVKIATTPPPPSPGVMTNGLSKKKKKHRDKSDLGDDFVAPDGGWGWLVSVASGINTLVCFAIAQQFGIIFRTHMDNCGIKSSELTTIINTQFAISAITGLLNGPMFRRFTFRQVALFGSVLTFLGIFSSAFATTFPVYILAYSLTYGFGRGLAISASTLALITYFKEKRRTATAYAFGVAGVGPIIFPYIATYSLIYYGVEGTVLLFSAASLHTIACALIYQPVLWHVMKKKSDDPEANSKPKTPRTIEDEIVTMAVPGTPIVPRAADGWFGSRLSLNTLPESTKLPEMRGGSSHRASIVEMQELKRRNSCKEQVYKKPRTFSISHSIKEEDDYQENDRKESAWLRSKSMDYGRQNIKMEEFRIKEEDTEVTHETTALKAKTKQELLEEIEREDEERRKLPLWRKIVIFFDFDLLRDFGYINISIGITLITFAEINFAILTPFILNDFGFNGPQIAMAMSLLGFCDLVVRFLVPPITARINLSNKSFFMVGIAGMCFGRLLLAFTRNFYCLLAIFLWLGLNKAFRTVFWNLIIPDYVPLKRVPAAAGLQLLIYGIFSLACGPLVGLIRDKTSYGFTLQFINLISIFALAMWLLEAWIQKRRKSSRIPNVEN